MFLEEIDLTKIHRLYTTQSTQGKGIFFQTFGKNQHCYDQIKLETD